MVERLCANVAAFLKKFRNTFLLLVSKNCFRTDVSFLRKWESIKETMLRRLQGRQIWSMNASVTKVS